MGEKARSPSDDLALLDLVRRAMAVCNGFDGPCSDSLWWRTDGEYAPITLFVNCNDLFVWACSDCERVTAENIGRLEEAHRDAKALGENGAYADVLWCARERKTRPQHAYYKHLPAEMHPLFNAVSDKPGYGWPVPAPEQTGGE